MTNDRWGFGVAVGDFDNDGWPDLYVANYGNSSVAVFATNGALAAGTATRLISGTTTGLNFPYGIFVR